MTTTRAHGQDGQTTAFVVTMIGTLLLCAGLVLDGGLVLAARTRLIGDADAAARAGAQELDLAAYRTTGRLQLDPARAATAARARLRAAGEHGQVTITGDQVHVTAATTVHTQLLRIAGLSEITVHAGGTAHPVRGVTGPAT